MTLLLLCLHASCYGGPPLSGFRIVADATSSSTGEVRTASRSLGEPRHLDLLTYNVFLRPAPVGWGDANECRARQIGRTLAQRADHLEVVALNESFSKPALHTLLDALGDQFPYRIVRQPEADFMRTNGGLTLLSRVPIASYRTRTFETCSGTDCLATKGFLHAVLRLGPRLRANVVATHLDAGDSWDARRTRRRQISTIQGYLETAPAVEQWPTLLLGDMNVDGLAHPFSGAPTARGSEYRRMLEAFGNDCVSCRSDVCRATCEASPVDAFRRTREPWSWSESATRAVNTRMCPAESLGDCRPTVGRPDWRARKRLDYILSFGPPRDQPDLAVDVRGAGHVSFEDDMCGTDYLSDHRAVQARIRLRRLAPSVPERTAER